MSQDDAELTPAIVHDAELTPAEIRVAEALIDHVLRRRAIPAYLPAERLVLTILAANLRRQQRNRGKKSKSGDKRKAEYRRDRVEVLLRYLVPQRYRDDPPSRATVMKIVEGLDIDFNIEANETQVRRDIHAVLKRGALTKY